MYNSIKVMSTYIIYLAYRLIKAHVKKYVHMYNLFLKKWHRVRINDKI